MYRRPEFTKEFIFLKMNFELLIRPNMIAAATNFIPYTANSNQNWCLLILRVYFKLPDNNNFDSLAIIFFLQQIIFFSFIYTSHSRFSLLTTTTGSPIRLSILLFLKEVLCQ